MAEMSGSLRSATCPPSCKSLSAVFERKSLSTGPSLDKCTSCGDAHHHLCAAENVWLKWIGDDEIEGRKCFDCWLLEAQLRNTVHQLQVKPQP